VTAAEAEARAARNGLTLETYDGEFGAVWPGVRFAGVRLMRGREVVGWATHSYRDEASKKRALSSSLAWVYKTPARADQAPVTQGRVAGMGTHAAARA
jgi:hypothetical protein